jgi:two-component system chemotaxis response regulator CheB
VIGDGLKTSRATDDEKIIPSHVFVAPPDRHLVLEQKKMRVVFGPKENGHRPAADVLFRSAAHIHGPRVIGVVLTGALSDGAAGLAEVKACGGLTIVQDPSDAFQPGMPRNAMDATEVDHVLPLQQIAAKLASLTQGRVRAGRTRVQAPASPSSEPARTFICPQCGGALREMYESDPVSFRCHTGHAYTLPSLVGEQKLTLEAALWAAVRTLKERAALQRRLAETTSARGFAKQAELAERHAQTIESMITSALHQKQTRRHPVEPRP